VTLGSYTEDALVQQTTVDYLEQRLGWESVYAYDREDFGPQSLLGRSSAVCRNCCIFVAALVSGSWRADSL
jgi:hypothetical protein